LRNSSSFSHLLLCHKFEKERQRDIQREGGKAVQYSLAGEGETTFIMVIYEQLSRSYLGRTVMVEAHLTALYHVLLASPDTILGYGAKQNGTTTR
jgi:hypothetical protein